MPRSPGRPRHPQIPHPSLQARCRNPARRLATFLLLALQESTQVCRSSPKLDPACSRDGDNGFLQEVELVHHARLDELGLVGRGRGVFSIGTNFTGSERGVCNIP
jgi:hypothetical protein